MKRTFKWIGICVSVALLLLLGLASNTHGATLRAKSKLPFAGKNLVIASWGGVWTANSKKYFGDPFAKASGAKVTYQEVGTGFAPQSIQMEKTGNVQWDVLDGAGSDVYVLEHAGYLQHFSPSLLKTLNKLSRPGQANAFNLDFGDTASIITCNPAVMKKCPTNPKQFWDTKNFPGPRAINNNALTASIFAVEAAGVRYNKIWPLNLSLAFKKLREIKSSIKVWPDSGAQQQQVMIDGEVGASIMWNGRAYTVKQSNLHNLRMYWSGAEVGDGGIAVLKGAPDMQVAMAYVKWFAQHSWNQAQWTKALTYPSPTKQLLNLVPHAIAAALPAAHHPIVVEDNNWLIAHNTELEKAWQSFITGS